MSSAVPSAASNDSIAEQPLRERVAPVTQVSTAAASSRANLDPSLDVPVVLERSPSLLQPAVLFALVAALGLGITIGYVLFGGEKVKIVREIVEVPAPTLEGEPQAPSAEAEAGSEEPSTAAEMPGAPPVKKSGGATKLAAAPTEQPAGEGLSGLSGLKGLSAGPRAGPDGSGPASSTQPLESSQIQGTVNRYTPAVRRSCWQPALDARDPGAPTSARVTVSLTIGPDGAVRSAAADGAPNGYPGLSSCITQRVRTWTFPPSSGTTTVQVPFVFASAQ